MPISFSGHHPSHNNKPQTSDCPPSTLPRSNTRPGDGRRRRRTVTGLVRGNAFLYGNAEPQAGGGICPSPVSPLHLLLHPHPPRRPAHGNRVLVLSPPAQPHVSGSRDKRGGGGNEKGSGSSGGKGEEKEAEAKGRERDSGFGFDGGSHGSADHDDNSDGGGVPQNLGSKGSVLHGLLRRIGVSLDDFIPSSGLLPASLSQQDVRLNNILSGLRSNGEEGRQVALLTQICEMLSIGTEDSLITFSVDS